MPATQAMIGYGTVLEIALASAPTDYTYIAETKSHTPPSFTDATVDVTHMQSPNGMREYVSGLGDAGESTHEMNWVPGSATDVFLRSIARKNLVVRLTFPNGRQMIYNAVRSGYETDVPTDEGLTATLTLKVSGDPIVTGVTSPRAMVEPSIDGTAQVGVPLTLDRGVWAGAKNFSQQWKVAGVAVTGETGTSYVPVEADIGETVTVAVVGGGNTINVTVESDPTAAVIAA